MVGFIPFRKDARKMSTRFLEENLGRKVLVRLRSGELLRGVLESFDRHLNLVIDETVKLGDQDDTILSGRVMLRGSNVVTVSISKTRDE